MVARARLRLGLVVGLAITALLALVAASPYALLVRSQEAQIQREVAWGAANGVIAGPPACSWVFGFDNGVLVAANNPPPAGFPLRTAVDRVTTTGIAQDITVSRDGTVYYVHTERRGDAVVQVVFDARFQLADRRHPVVGVQPGGTGRPTRRRRDRRPGRPSGGRAADRCAGPAASFHRRREPRAAYPDRPGALPRAQLLARRAAAASVADRRDLDRLVAGTHRLGEIVDELLLSARLAATSADRPAAGPVDLTALAVEAVAAEILIGPRARPGPVTSPSRTAPLLVPGIESALRRVISELLANALAHLPNGGRISVTVRDIGGESGRAEVLVADTGDGFDPADAERIFDRFPPRPGRRRASVRVGPGPAA